MVGGCGAGRTVAGMPRHQPVNAAFEEALRGLYGGQTPDGLLMGAFGALGVPAGEELDAAQFPVLGFFVTATDKFLLYVLTPGRFVRYEVADSRSLTIAIPVHKVSRVLEETGPGKVTVQVELDADASTIITEYRETADAEDPAVLVGRSAGKTVRTSYTLEATAQEEGRQLMAFSLALRNTLGA